jgi:uncharacterized protein DUF3309
VVKKIGRQPGVQHRPAVLGVILIVVLILVLMGRQRSAVSAPSEKVPSRL